MIVAPSSPPSPPPHLLQTLHYGVSNVPTLVMLDARGTARARVGRPADVEAAAAAAERLVAVATGKK